MSAAARTAEFFARVLRRDSLNERAVLIRFLFVVEALLEEPATDAKRVAQIRDALAAAEALLAETWRAGLDSGDRADVTVNGDIALSSTVTGNSWGCPRCPRAALSRDGDGDRDKLSARERLEDGAW